MCGKSAVSGKGNNGNDRLKLTDTDSRISLDDTTEIGQIRKKSLFSFKKLGLQRFVFSQAPKNVLIVLFDLIRVDCLCVVSFFMISQERCCEGLKSPFVNCVRGKQSLPTLDESIHHEPVL